MGNLRSAQSCTSSTRIHLSFAAYPTDDSKNIQPIDAASLSVSWYASHFVSRFAISVTPGLRCLRIRHFL